MQAPAKERRKNYKQLKKSKNQIIKQTIINLSNSKIYLKKNKIKYTLNTIS